MRGERSLANWSKGLKTWLRPWAEALVASARGRVRVTNTYRSRSEQLRLWNARKNNPYPVAPPGTSKHEQGRAFDLVGDPAVLAQLGRLWESWGGRWGGRFHDDIHFEA